MPAQLTVAGSLSGCDGREHPLSQARGARRTVWHCALHFIFGQRD
jgi:hypothetical protein